MRAREYTFEEIVGITIRVERKRRGYKSLTAFAAEVEQKTGVNVSFHSLYKVEQGKQSLGAKEYAAIMATLGLLKDETLATALSVGYGRGEGE